MGHGARGGRQRRAGAAVEGLGGGEVTRRRFRGPALGGDGPQLQGVVAAFGFLERLRGLSGGGASVLGEASWSPGSSALGSADPRAMSPHVQPLGIRRPVWNPVFTPSTNTLAFFPMHGKIPSRACIVDERTIPSFLPRRRW